MSFANKKIPLQGKKEYSEINYEFESVNEIILTRGINGKKVIMFKKKKKTIIISIFKFTLSIINTLEL